MSVKSWDFEPNSSADKLVRTIRSDTDNRPFDLAVILGSGWSEAATLGRSVSGYDYRDWTCFPANQIAGHQGALLVRDVQPWRVLFFVGRFHPYQGLSAFDAAFPVRLASALGCKRMLLTCATGGVNRNYLPGDFMLVDDHLNLLGDNPLRGLPGDTFLDLSELYYSSLYPNLLNNSATSNARIHRGVLAAMPGPSYETPAEIKMLSMLGADVVSMSTVHEAIMGHFLGMEVAALAFVANQAAGYGPQLSHADVLDCADKYAKLSKQLIQNLIAAWQVD